MGDLPLLQWVPDVKRGYHDRIPAELWESHRLDITEHYLGSTLEETRDWMSKELNFSVSYVTSRWLSTMTLISYIGYLN